MEINLSHPLKHYTHYYMSIENVSSFAFVGCTIVEFSSLQPFSQFLILPQIQEIMFTRMRSESIIDYSHSQILKFNDHVQK